ncbi:hypothetical protein NEOLEDRAFT_1182154 [Neolentinus lepideus HHB14362 ss-1]|uniref:ATP-citrate synthase citrate-binding domain-containing protein n=1 Tax=Neolentinus lepideus HHB14362 ss-1 TaxID=1314782 RepID=A0A165PF13_9AGAM|nr:hypothetical protein NEOLEDRAFT_1182154 [Neolentinus lepideus HHB14362 ss-1]
MRGQGADLGLSGCDPHRSASLGVLYRRTWPVPFGQNSHTKQILDELRSSSSSNYNGLLCCILSDLACSTCCGKLLCPNSRSVLQSGQRAQPSRLPNVRLYSQYVDLHFAYLEINPLVVLDAVNGGQPQVQYLDMAKLDASTGASLKLTVLNPAGRIWTMVAGGGASVVYSDTIAVHGFVHELANYGEYSGAPSEGQTYEYAKTILDLITRGEVNREGKILIIGGGGLCSDTGQHGGRARECERSVSSRRTDQPCSLDAMHRGETGDGRSCAAKAAYIYMRMRECPHEMKGPGDSRPCVENFVPTTYNSLFL